MVRGENVPVFPGDGAGRQAAGLLCCLPPANAATLLAERCSGRGTGGRCSGGMHRGWPSGAQGVLLPVLCDECMWCAGMLCRAVLSGYNVLLWVVRV